MNEYYIIHEFKGKINANSSREARNKVKDIIVNDQETFSYIEKIKDKISDVVKTNGK